MSEGVFNWYVDPVIFWLSDSFPIKYYGLLFVSGLFLSHYILKQIYIKEGLSVESLEKLFIYCIVGTVLGARLGHCLFYEPAYYLQHPLEIFLPIKKVAGAYRFIGFQGLASHGGTIGVLIAIGLYCKKYKIHFLNILDKVALVAPIAAAFIRLGNFMNSEIYGKPTNGNWGVVFQRDDIIPRHPTQFYEAFSYLIIFVILMWLYKHKAVRQKNGIILGVFLVLFFLARFFIEFFKENQVAFENKMALNMGQFLSIPFIVIGLILLIYDRSLRRTS